ncbi:MAG: hypothetical protein AAF235_07820, partial [Planctomycetota bacterium]
FFGLFWFDDGLIDTWQGVSSLTVQWQIKLNCFRMDRLENCGTFQQRKYLGVSGGRHDKG